MSSRDFFVFCLSGSSSVLKHIDTMFMAQKIQALEAALKDTMSVSMKKNCTANFAGN